MTETIIAFIIAFIIAAVFIKLIERRDERNGGKANRAEAQPRKKDCSWYDAEDLFEYDKSFNIAGVNKHGLAPADCGVWKGFVECEPDNQYDPNAVAVIKGASQHIGYLSREIAATNHEAIADEGGKLPCIVRIERKFDDDEARYYFVGRVQILWPGTA